MKHVALRLSGLSAFVLVGNLSVPAAANNDPPAPPVPHEPREETGFSQIEQRWVYGQPDEGELEFKLHVNALPDEVAIETPDMCENPVEVKVKYDKAKNKVKVKAKFKHLPYRPDVSRENDISNAWNQHLTHVEDARWQIWFIGELFTQDVLYYYDGLTTEFLGSEFDLEVPPPNAIPVVIPGVQMIGSPIFEGPPDGNFTFTWELDYDQMLDRDGNGGVYNAFIPERLCAPDKNLNYYVQGGVPPELAMSFDDVLASIHSGNGMFMAVTAEPYPKPDFLESRSNIMTAYQGGYPQGIPDGYHLDFRGVTLELRVREQCGETHQMPPWPEAYYDFCAPAP